MERAIVIAFLFINQFGTPVNWFRQFTGLGSGGGSNPILVGGSLLLVLLFLPSLIGRGDRVIKMLHNAPFLFAFLGLVLVSFMWSDFTSITLVDTLNLMVLSVFGLILAVRFTIREFLSTFSIALGVGLVMSLLWVVALPRFGTTPAGWSGLGVGKNDLGNDGVIGALVLLLTARILPRWRHALYLGGIVALVLLVGSQSKTSLAAGMLTLGSLVIFQAFRSRRTLFGAVALTLTSATIVAFLFVTANISLLAGYLEKDASLSGRTTMWPLVVDAIASRPILGFGYGGYWNGYFSPSFRVLVENTWMPNHAHNAILEIALDLGLVGVVLFLLVNAGAIARGVHFIQRIPGPAGLFPLAYLTLAVMVSTTESGPIEQRTGWVVFVFVVLTLAGSDVSAKHKLDHSKAFSG